MAAHDESTPCPICEGRGTVTYVDEEVGCRVEIPCWACSDVRETAVTRPFPP